MGINGINNNPYLYIGTKTVPSSRVENETADKAGLLTFQGKNDKLSLDNKTSNPNISTDSLKLKLELLQAKKQQGLIGKVWDGFKNFTGIGAGSNKAEEAVKQFEQGIISSDEARQAIADYKEGQEICVDVAADIVSGIISVGAFALAVPTGGASLVFGLTAAAAAGAGVKVGIKTFDALSNGKGYSGKNLLYDAATGGINGLLAPVTNGLGNTVAKTIAKKLGLKVIQGGAEQAVSQGIKQTAKGVILNQTIDIVGGGAIGKRAAALGVGMAVDGTVGGASDGMLRAALNGEDIFEAGVQGAIGGMIMAPVIGGGFRAAAKAGKSLKNLDVDGVKSKTNNHVPASAKDEVGNRVITPKTKVDHDSAVRAAQTVTDDVKLQAALVRMAENEGIVIRTKEDAIPILRRQYEEIKDKGNLFVLDINPQKNNGMPKSNNLISQWYVEANGLSQEQLITLSSRELKAKPIQPDELCSEWALKTPMYSKLQRASRKLKDNPMTIQEAREVVEGCKNLNASQIIDKYGEEKLIQAMNRMNTLTLEPSKNGGHTRALAEQMRKVLQEAKGEPVTFVIPDDCSLSGSSILCDTVRILNNLEKNGKVDNKINIVFSPMILGEKAEDAIGKFRNPDFALNDAYLRDISVLDRNLRDAFKNSREMFERVKGMDNINIEISNSAIKAVHFTETETFKQIGRENPVLQKQLLYLMQGPIQGNHALYGGFGDCGVMVVTPTDAFTLNGQTYAGKIPTNSVGFMEVLGQESGVLNDSVPDKKGLFTKGTGKGYSRYCEWSELFAPKKEADRIPIIVENGNIFLRNAS